MGNEIINIKPNQEQIKLQTKKIELRKIIEFSNNYKFIIIQNINGHKWNCFKMGDSLLLFL